MIYKGENSIKVLFFALVFFTKLSICCAQDQRIADSLALLFAAQDLTDSYKIELLDQLVQHENRDMNLLRSYAQELIDISAELEDWENLHDGHMALGHYYRITGIYDKALESYFKAREIAFNNKDPLGVANANTTIGDTYSEQMNHEKSLEYHELALEYHRQDNEPGSLAGALYNYGDALIKSGSYDKALHVLRESDSIFRNVFEHKSGIAYCMGNIGLIYAKKGEVKKGLEMMDASIQLLKEMEDHYALSDFYLLISDIFEQQRDIKRSIEYAQLSLESSEISAIRANMSLAHLQLSDLFQESEDLLASHYHLESHLKIKDSILNSQIYQQQEALRADYEIAQREAQVNLLSQQRRNQRIILWATAIVALLLSIMAFSMYRKNKFVEHTNKIIEAEQNRSENLLLNILPKETAQELLERGRVKAKKFESVSVLFTDFIGFTRYAEYLDPEKLVQSMDFYYAQFDDIIDKYGLEKIKTVGDSYMCAGGLPHPDPEHAVKIVRAAQEIVAFVDKAKKESVPEKIRFDVRVGINSGPLVAGVVGTKKFAYDIWGDTVNVAARMESSSEAGKINISENTYKLVRHLFDCEYRGEILVKNRGKLRMYFVQNGIRPVRSRSRGKKQVKAI